MTARPPRRRAGHAAPAPFARYLVATDFSPAAGRALERAAHLAAVRGGEIHLLHVEAPGTSAAARSKARRALTGALQAIRDIARRSGVKRLRAACSVKAGDPHVQIIRCAREWAADIVVLGKGGSAAARAWNLGTTAARVVRMSDTPTLLVGRPARGPYERPLVAVEIDPSARALIDLTRRVVGSDAPPLRIVHAYRVPFESYYLASRDSSAAGYFREARKSAAGSVAKLLESIDSHRYRLQTALRRGDARSVIAKEAAHWRADLIALGTHGRSGVAHALLGSVAEWVIANTSQDVLVARPVRFTFVPP